MIASHDTFTYLKARSWKANLLKHFWHCQNLTIKQQYKAGVRYFDIRVCKDEDKWRICHNMAEFNKTFSNLRLICTYITNNFNNAIFRLILEKGDCATFREEIRVIAGRYKSLVEASIKRTGEILYHRENHPELIDLTKHKFNIFQIITGLFINYIKKNSKNIEITLEMIDDLKKVYLLDFIK